MLSSQPLSVVAAAAADLTIRLVDEATPTIQVVDNSASTEPQIIASQLLSETSAVEIQGSNGNDRLTIDPSVPVTLAISFAGGAGSDTLVGPSVDSTWQITGANAGAVGGVTYTDVENLTGAPDNQDTFVFQPGASLSGVVDGGGGGFDTLVIAGGTYSTVVYTASGPTSGSIDLDGNVISYTGLEPLTAGGTAADVIFNLPAAGDNQAFLEDNGTPGDGVSRLRSGNASFETTTFSTPTGSVTINLGNGGDSITLKALDSLFDADVSVHGGTGADDIVFGAKTGPGTYTANGGGDTDTIEATRNADFTLTNTQLMVDSDAIALSSIEQANLTGGVGANTFTITGWTGTGTLAGAGGGSDTVALTKNAADFTLKDNSLSATGGPSMTLTSIEVANLTGGAGDNTFTVGDVWSGTANLTGLGGNDTYVVDDDWGTVNVAEATSGGKDTLDFSLLTGDTLTVSADKTIIKSSDGSKLTQTGAELAEEIDVSLVSGFTGAAGELKNAFNDLATFVDRLQTAAGAIAELISQIPLLNQAGGSLAGLIGLTQAFQDFRDEVNGIINGLGATPKLSTVISALNGLTLPAPFSTITFSTDYRGQPPATTPPGADDFLEVLIDVDLAAHVAKMIDLTLGADAENLGIDIDAQFSVDVDLTGHLTVGLTTTGPATVFLVPGGTLTLAVDANAALAGTSINLGLLELAINSGSADVEGGLKLQLTDPSNADGLDRITLTELTTASGMSLVTVTEDKDPSTPAIDPQIFDVTAAVTVSPGVEVGGVDLSAASVSVMFSVELSGSIFGGATPTISLTADRGTPLDLSDDIDLLDFSNLSPTEVLGMLGQVLDTFTAMAKSQLLQAEIPFSGGKTLGDVLDFATAFKTKVLDPLFVSGDLSRADNDGDGAPDLNFSSIQGLVDQLTTALGLGTPLKAAFDPISKELTFTIDFEKSLGFGEAKVAQLVPGGGGNNEKQTITVNATGGTFRLAFPDDKGLPRFTAPIAFDAPATGAGSVEARLEALKATDGVTALLSDVEVTKSSNVYTVTFKGTVAGQDVPLLTSDAGSLTGAVFPVNFGASLGDLAGIQTAGSFSLSADLTAGLTFGINLSPSQTLEIVPPVYSPAAAVTVERPAGATDNKIQILTVKNASSGQFVVSFGTTGPTDAVIDFNATAGAVETALEGLGDITDVTVALTDQTTVAGVGNQRIYVITFNNPGAPAALLTALSNPANPLKGPADNGKLSAAANFDVKLFYSPAVAITTTQEGAPGTNEEQKVTILNATGGTFTLGFDGAQTTPLDRSATAGDVQAALELLAGIGSGNVLVSLSGDTYTVTFQNDLAETDVSRLKADGSGLVNATPFASLSNVTVNADGTNASPQDLAADVQTAVDEALMAAAKTLGFLSADLADGVPFEASHDPLSTPLPSDLSFTIPARVTVATTQQGDGTHNEVQKVTVRQAKSGTFTLSFSGETTTPIPFNAPASAVEAALEALTGITDVTVTKLDRPLKRETDFTVIFVDPGNTNVATMTADASGFKGFDGRLRKIDADTAPDLATALHDAIADALAAAGITDISVAVGTNGSHLTLTSSGGNLALRFASPIRVQAGGGRISLSALPVKLSAYDLAPAVNVDGRLETSTEFQNPAFQELGLLSAPTRFNGVTTDPIKFTLIVNGTALPDVNVAEQPGNTTIDDLVSDLQGAINTQLTAQFGSSDQDADGTPDIQVFRIDQGGVKGNRLGLRGDRDVVSKLSLNVPLDRDSATAGIQLNAAVTELGYATGTGETRRAKASEFFLEDVSLGGSFALATPTPITVEATLGFLGLTATGQGTLGGNKFVDASINFSLKDPLVDPTDPGENPDRVTVDVLTKALTSGKFLYDPTQFGDLDPDPAVIKPKTGVVDGSLSGSLGFSLDVEPSGVLAGVPGLDAFLKITSTSPNWLVALPSFGDPLGIGFDEVALSVTPFTLGTVAPSDGQLTQNVTFALSDGAHDAVGVLLSKDTTGFATREQLRAALETAIADALADLAAAGGASDNVVEVGVDAGGALTLARTAGSGDLSIRGPIAFEGPDVEAILDRFRDLSFADVIAALRLLIDFLRDLDGSGGGGALAGALDTKLPIIDRSIADLVDVAGDFAERLDAIEANPAGSVQTLETLLRDQLGIPSGLPPILSFDPSEGVLGFNFNFGTEVSLTRPFNLDLSTAGLPEFLQSLVGLSASGNLAVNASVSFDLAMGLDLTGDDKAFFLVTDDASTSGVVEGTKLTATATVSGQNLNFTAQLGPFGVFVIDGTASLNGTVEVGLIDADSDGRLVLVGFGGSGVTTDLSHLDDFVGVDSITVTGDAHVDLPLFIGTVDNPIPIGSPNSLVLDVPDLVAFIEDPSDVGVVLAGEPDPDPLPAMIIRLPDFSLFTDPPSIFLLLSDPAIIIDGLDRLLQTLQQALNGQIFGIKLPLVGDLLANNPAANIIEDFRDDFLQPLANTIRQNNLNLDGLVGLIKQTIVGVFGPSGPFGGVVDPVTGIHGLLRDQNSDGMITADDDVIFRFLDGSGGELPNFIGAVAAQLDFDIGKTFSFLTPKIAIDLGIPVLGISLELQPEVTIDFNLHIGFGVDTNKGFYFVTDTNGPAAGQGDPELSVSVSVDFTQDANANNVPDESERAKVNGRLLFLALKLTDGVDVNGDGLHFSPAGSFDPDTEDFTRLFLGGTVDIVDPNGDGELTIPEMVSGSFSDIVQPALTGGAVLRAHGEVDFSTLDESLASVLPSVSAEILVDFVFSATPSAGLTIHAPQVIFADITLDLGSFISRFAGPILNSIGDILEPFDWLIGPDGFLNMRIPLLSDLAGTTITGKDLISFFDPDDGPKVVALLDFVEQLFFLIDLVHDAASEGSVMLNFGDLVLSDDPGIDNHLVDHEIVLGLPGGPTTDLRSLKNFKDATVPTQPSSPPAGGAKTQQFTAGVTRPGSIDFPILKPENIIKLLLGQSDVTLVLVELPKFGFSFFYRQEFPIIGPLVGFFGGGVSGSLELGFGYDTRGLEQFLATKNPATLVNGFFLSDIDFTTGFDRPEGVLSAQIAVGAGLSLGLVKAGVEGGIVFTIDFNLADLDGDGKVRVGELVANVAANLSLGPLAPLAIFDVQGSIELFLRAFVEINLLITSIRLEFEFARLTLFEFEIPFERPSLLASQTGDTLTLNIGPNAANRLRGDINDIGETVHVKTIGTDVVVFSDQFNVSEAVASLPTSLGFFRFAGVTKIVADGGEGNDVIDLSQVTASGITAEIHGRAGNDFIIGGAGDDMLFGDGGDDSLLGNGGDDVLEGGLGADKLFGDGLPGVFDFPGTTVALPAGAGPVPIGTPGKDVLKGQAGDDLLFGGDGDDVYVGGAGSDKYQRSDGDDTYRLADFGSIEEIDGSALDSDVLDFSDMTQNLAFFLLNPGSGLQIQVGFNQIPGTAGTSISNFNSQVLVKNVDGITKIIGSDFTDTFNVFQTVGSGITLDGNKGSDKYTFNVGSPTINATVDDTGNPWDSGDLIEVIGTGGSDTITVTSSDITLSGTEVVHYVAPAADANVLQIKVFGKGGDDTLNVESTAETVPVRVDGGSGNDLVTVGGSGTVDDIAGLARTGLNPPFGLGPLVLVGGSGQDQVVVDDGADTSDDTGNLTAFVESRMGIGNVEVGVVSGLGMTLGAGVGRVEFEGFETVDVKMGTGSDTFTVGGDAILGDLPQNRQTNVQEFTNTLTGMTIVEGGGGADTIGVIATNTLDRDTLLTAAPGPLVTATTQTQGDDGSTGNPLTDEVQTVTVKGAARGVGFFTIGFRFVETAPIRFGASADEVRDALVALRLIGTDASNNPNVDVIKALVAGDDVYTITFQNGKAHQDVAPLVPRITPLLIAGDAGADTLNVQSIRETTFFRGGDDQDTVDLNVDVDTVLPLTSNGVNAQITLDGQGAGDTYNVNLIGGITASLVNVFDSGLDNDSDKLTVIGTELPDLFLLRAAAATTGLAFIAMLNHDDGLPAAQQPVERVNYDINLETIIVNSLDGDDQFYIDDTRATITVNAGDGNDFFQIGQLYQTQRTPDEAGVAEADVYATIETTKGFLSNGISFPMTINGDAGEDLWIVFHNLAVATLNGGADDDTFIIQAFALAGSTEDHRALTDLSGDAGADFIQYAVDAPVNINGGDGFDTVIIIGTEFGDDFVVTPHGVFGAGLNVNFINIESLQVDGAEGDDRFFVLGTSPDIVTEITGSLGTDLFSINGPTPANGVISNDLRGHSGILTHEVTSSDLTYNGLKVVGISANVADNDEAAIVVTQSDGASMVVQGNTAGLTMAEAEAAHLVDSYTIVLSRPPVNETKVVINIDPPPGLVFVEGSGSVSELRDVHGNAMGLGLEFTANAADPTAWFKPQTVRFKVDGTLGDIPDLGDIQHKVVAKNVNTLKAVPEVTGTVTGGDNGSPVIVTTTTPGDASHNEVQQVTVANTSGFGFFTLTFRDEETDPIPFGAMPGDVATALLALPLIGTDASLQPNVAVTGPAGGPYTITFQNGLALQDVEPIKGREEATLVDTALPAALAMGGAEGLPEGLRGAFVKIADSASHPEIVGQTRLILFSDFSTLNHKLVVNKPWFLGNLSALPTDATYEISLYSGLSIPNVRARIFSNQTPAIVVSETQGSTSVGEISSSTVPGDITAQLGNTQVDQIDVRPSTMPVGGATTVQLDGHGQLEFFDKDNLGAGAITALTFTAAAGSWDTFRHILVRGIDDLVKEGFHKSDLTLSASGGGYTNVSSLLVTDITDNEAPGVRITESHGSTDVIEFTSGEFGGVTTAMADATNAPWTNTYQVVLTKAPTGDVTVNLVSNPTRTSRTGGIRSFVQQLEISTDNVTFHKGDASDPLTVTFTSGNWNVPKTIYVRALDNDRVDGSDTQVFAPTLDLLNSIQGPLFINGSLGDDHTGLTEREPIMLPGERNEKPEMGNVVAAAEAVGVTPATITIDPTQIDSTEIDALNAQPNATAHPTFPLDDPNELRNVSVQITAGPGKNKVRVVTEVTAVDEHHWVLTLSHAWFSPFPEPGNADVPGATSKYVLLQTNPNLLVVEEDQTDILQVHDSDNVNDFNDAHFSDPNFPDGNPFAIGQLFFDDQNLFGAKATVSTQVNGGPKVDGPTVNEVQRLVITATAGTFTLIFNGQTTGAIPFNPTAAQIQSALEGLSNIAPGDVVVTKPSSDPEYLIEFTGALGLTDQPKMHADTTGLTGGTPLNDFRITGLGMGGNGPSFQRTIGAGTDARSEPGGITLHDFEDVEIDLGPGNDHFTIVDTQEGVKTTLNMGAGNDLVDVKSISGHTFVNLGAGDDIINVHNDGHTLQDLQGLLTVSGDVPRADVVTLAKGSPTQGSLVASVDEIQQLTIDATGGTFTLSLTNPANQVTVTTAALAFDINAAALQSALQTLAQTAYGVSAATPDVLVTEAGNVYRVTFADQLGAQDIPLLAANETGLVNGLGAQDTMNVDGGGFTSPSVGVLTSSSLTGLSTKQVNEIQTIAVDATQGTFTVSFNGNTSGPLDFNISAANLQNALQTLPGTPIKVGDVAVTKNDDVYVIRFQGNLTNTDVAPLGVANVNLMKQVEPSAGNPDTLPSGATAIAGDPGLIAGSVAAATRVPGLADPKINDEQLVTVKATGGTYTLTLLSGTPQQFTTAPISFDASAEFVRQTIQNAAAAAVAPGDTFEPQKFAVTVDKYAFEPNGEHNTVYIIGFQGRLRQFNFGPGVDLLKVNAGGLTGTAAVTTRMDGINYYGIETLNIDLGSNNDMFDVQGTSAGSLGFAQGGGVAVTNVRLHNGDEQVFVSSNAELDFATAPGFDFLTGNLDDVRGALNLDLGAGRHKLMISDEGATVGDPSVVITDTRNAPAQPGLDANAEIWITGLAPAGISYQAGTVGNRISGNIFDGILEWAGSGNDSITIDGTINRSGSGQRTMTLLNTGLGNDNVTVNLNGALNVSGSDTGQDGFFALNTMGGSFSPIPTTAAVTDNDTVNASGSSLPLVIFGGLGNDNITGGTNNDIIFGDDGRVQYFNPASPGTLLAVVGFGGRGDLISSQVLQPTWAFSRDLTLGGQDTVQGNAGEDILVGGAAGDTIDGNADDDLIFGDAVKISRRPTDITNPRFETLIDGVIYATPTTNAAGADQADGTARNYRDPNGTFAPSWALWRIHNLYHTLDIQNAVPGSLGSNSMLTAGTNIANSFGGDYIAGGGGSDEIFGQLGNDTIQGDGSITSGAGASRDTSNNLILTASFEASTDGDDYTEGNGGNDTVFGGLGQDDIIGGNSDLFTLNTYDKRPDGADMIFGGSGQRAGRLADVVSGVDSFYTERHGRDADMIIGDNGDIFRLVGTNHTDGGAFLTFNYDVNGLASEGYAATRRIIPRAARLLDYTLGGPDFTGTTEAGPADIAINPTTTLRDIGAADEAHGESGDDFIYGMVRNDVLFGDSQDDNIVGGYGADWVSGGTGDDGILGDDGRLFASRNSTSYGEPLYGIAAIASTDINKLISTPTPATQAVTNVAGLLKYTADLTPQNLQPNQPTPPDPLFRPLYANDLIYGGLGTDSIHAGAGDDAISGAEALATSYTNNYDQSGIKTLSAARSDFDHPFNPGNVLGYNPTTTKFFLYDANDPRRKILLNDDGTLNKTNIGKEWILNFSDTEGPLDTKWITGTTYPAKPTDGDDHIFADLGHDWSVGGTGRDAIYSGWGDDLANADDVLTSNGGLNSAPDTNPSWEDLVFGGAGLDVLILNTNGDRGMDWVGEFNTYLTPYAQYGAVSVNRQLMPQEPEFLYALSKSEGADQTLAAQYSSDPTRNGEPFGELGVVLQQDAAWQAQTGPPRDPQAGNTSGGKVDIKNNPGTAGAQPIYETAAGPESTLAGATGLLTDGQLAPIVAQAKLLWAQALGAGDARLAGLDGVQVEVGNLPDDRLGVTIGDLILIDSGAAGRGWFVDPTPWDSQEFAGRGNSSGLLATHPSGASGRMDLLTTVTHELGNALGFKEVGTPGNVMAETLGLGVRGLNFDALMARTETEPESVTGSSNGARAVSGAPRYDGAQPIVDWDAEIGGLLSSLSPYGEGPGKNALKPLFPAFEYAGSEGQAPGRRAWMLRSGEESLDEEAQGAALLPSTGWEWRVEVGASSDRVSRSEGEPVL